MMDRVMNGFAALRQFTSTCKSKQEPLATSQSIQPMTQTSHETSKIFPRRPNNNIVESNETDNMEIDESDSEDSFVNAQEHVADEHYHISDDPNENSFFAEAFGDAPIAAERDIRGTPIYVDQHPFPIEDDDTKAPPESIEDDHNSTSSDPDPPQDLFSSTFGEDADQDHDTEPEDDDGADVEMLDQKPQQSPKLPSPSLPAPSPKLPSLPPQPPTSDPEPEPERESLFLQTLHSQGYDFVPCEHTPGCTCEPILRLSTPPYLTDPYVPTTYPSLPSALTPALLAYKKWHARASLYVPQLSTRDAFDSGRRYWIAVLVQGKRPDKTTSAREYVWMKGNRFSTVATVWHHYQTTTMADPDDLVLLLGYERPAMTDQVQNLDHFADRLVVFRAVGAKHPDARGRGLTEGLVPEVIELD